ncbi:MAG TPA: ABC transporter ATP-binding protein [Stellaceae bacterium]|nr:ABC transporter ATP-binding protein [Stellaceae bacterium]
MLEVRELQTAYGRSQVLFDIGLDVAAGEVVALLGRNGMGKTTTIRSILGLTPPLSGEVRFDGRPIAGAAPETIARLGIGLVPEGRRVFTMLTVRENLVATAANRAGHVEPWTLDKVYDLFPRLAERHAQSAGTLSGGEQQMLAIGRALMTNPRLLILDEATEGLAPLIRREIWRCLRQLKSTGQAILVVDKNIMVLKHLADRFVVIEKGRTVWRGDAMALDAEPAVIQNYLGV